MVTQRQHRIYTKMQKQLISVYHKKEAVRLNILTLPHMLEKFYDRIEADNEMRQKLEPIIGDLVFPDIPFLQVLVKDMNDCQVRSMEYLTRNILVHKELDRTMKAFVKSSKIIEAEEYSTKDAAIVIEKLSKRINKIEKKIIDSSIKMNAFKKEFTALQIRYQYLNN